VTAPLSDAAAGGSSSDSGSMVSDSVARAMRSQGLDPEMDTQRRLVQEELDEMRSQGIAGRSGVVRLPPELLTPHGSPYSHLEQIRSRLHFLEQVLVCSNLRLRRSEMQHEQVLWRSLISMALTRESLHLSLMWFARMARPALLGAFPGDTLTSLPGDELSAGTSVAPSPAGKHRRCVPLRFLPSDEQAEAEQAPAGAIGVKSSSAKRSTIATRQLFTPKFAHRVFDRLRQWFRRGKKIPRVASTGSIRSVDSAQGDPSSPRFRVQPDQQAQVSESDSLLPTDALINAGEVEAAVFFQFFVDYNVNQGALAVESMFATSSKSPAQTLPRLPAPGDLGHLAVAGEVVGLQPETSAGGPSHGIASHSTGRLNRYHVALPGLKILWLFALYCRNEAVARAAGGLLVLLHT